VMKRLPSLLGCVIMISLRALLSFFADRGFRECVLVCVCVCV
jgi:hypothetical protein